MTKRGPEFGVARLCIRARRIAGQALLFGGVSALTLSPWPPSMVAQGQEVIDCERMQPGQFEQLPDAQRVSCGGEVKTAGEIRRERQASRARGRAEAEQARAAAQAKLLELQREYATNASLQEAEVQIRAELTKLKQQEPAPAAVRQRLGTIRKEVARLEQELQAARDPNDKIKVAAQARELAEQLHAMGGAGGDPARFLFTKICQIADCGALSWLPHIDGVLSFSIISPGGPVILSGQHFGAQGTLWLKGSFGSRPMVIDSWAEGGIGAFFPSAQAIGSLSNLNLTLQVETSDGFMSNDVPLQWVQEVRLLDSSSVNVHNCGKDGNVNSCNWELYTGASCSSISETSSMILASKPPDPQCPCTAVGFHGNCWAAIGDDFGTDVYEIGPLQNGWTLLSFTFADSLPEIDSCDDANPPIGFQSGASIWAPDIPWCVTPNDELLYWLWVYIVGPKGFAH
jgi:hypothetical protein